MPEEMVKTAAVNVPAVSAAPSVPVLVERTQTQQFRPIASTQDDQQMTRFTLVQGGTVPRIATKVVPNQFIGIL